MGYYTNNGGLIGTTRIQTRQGVYDLPHSLAADFLFRFITFTFTNPIDAPWGPTSSEILNQAEYSTSIFASDTDFFRVIEGVQYWKVPVSAKYVITAKGPAGRHPSGISHQGRGGIVRASFLLAKGTILAILVGSRPPVNPTSGTYPPWQGGAGGTFVAVVPDWGDNTDSSTYPLLVAGGGSANRNSNTTYRLQATANMSPDGKNGNGSNGGDQGEGGSPGGMFYTGGGGGAGWDGVQNASADSRSLYYPGPKYPSNTSSVSLNRPGARGFSEPSTDLFGGDDFVGTGGVDNRAYATYYRGSGGYGGGGPGGWAGMGGAGGYSGGGNGDSGSYSRGGGGGSFINSGAISTTNAGKNIGTSTGSWNSGGGAFSGHSILATTSGLVNLGYNEGDGSVEITKW